MRVPVPLPATRCLCIGRESRPARSSAGFSEPTRRAAPRRIQASRVAGLALAVVACSGSGEGGAPDCCNAAGAPATGGAAGQVAASGGTEQNTGGGAAGGAMARDAGAAAAASVDARASGGAGGTVPGEVDARGPDCSTTPGMCDGSAASDAALPDATTASVKLVSSPPTYFGSVDGSLACSRRYATIGFEPDPTSPSRHPLFLYFAGTDAPHDAAASRAVTEAMTRRGFVALGVEYDNTWAALLSDHVNQLDCLFRTDLEESLLSAACSLPQVDCDLGIATWGHSQGALVAHMAANHDARVRAAWTTGYSGAVEGLFPAAVPSNLPKDRWRVVNGEGELAAAGTVGVLNQLTGFTASDCPDDGRAACFRSNGSGWIIVRRTDLASPELSSADHCWFDRRSCLDANTILEPNWLDPTSEKAFALESNADWLAETARRR